MQYTTQQLQGGPKYNHKTRIGNWNEDLELHNIQHANYNVKKNDGTLPFAKTISKYQQSYRQVPWSHSPDGNLRWGHQVMFQNAKTDGFLVMDIGERVSNVQEGYSVTCTSAGQNPGPMTRSVFQLNRVEEMDMFGDDEFIRYGQKVRITANRHLHPKSLSLTSAVQTPVCSAPLSGKQLVYMNAAKADADSIWIIDHVDPNLRFERQGRGVRAGEPVLLRHVRTCIYLASDDAYKVKNDFGSENEVHCWMHSSKNKSQNLCLEREGRITVDVPTKFQTEQNTFTILTAPDASYARPIEELAKFDVNDLLRDIKAKLFDKSSFGLRALKAIFSAMDQRRDGRLDIDDFRWGLMDYGIEITKEEGAELLKRFDRDGNGSVSFQEFLDTLRGGDLNESRLAVIRAAYDKLDVNKDGQVKLDDIAQLYDASQHPDVQAGRCSERDVYMEFMNTWDTQEKDGIISFSEFCSVLGDISAAYPDDAEFSRVLHAEFKI